MRFGEIIKKYRRDHNLSYRDFSALTGVSKSYIQALERGESYTTKKSINPSIEVLMQFASAMNMSVDQLIKKLDDDQFIYLDPDSFEEQFNPYSINIYGVIPAGIPMECIEDIIDTEELSPSMFRGGKSYFRIKNKG